jgi:hypothetical protein
VSGLKREVAFGECGLIREVTFGESGLKGTKVLY